VCCRISPVLSHTLYKRLASSNSPCRMWMISLTLTDYRKLVANDTGYSNWKFAASCSARMRVIVNYHCGCHNVKMTSLFEQTRHGVPRIRVKVFINCRIKSLDLKEELTGRIRWSWIISFVWRRENLFACWWNGNGEDIFLVAVQQHLVGFLLYTYNTMHGQTYIKFIHQNLSSTLQFGTLNTEMREGRFGGKS
jgi:hypothetical protein